MILCEFLKEKCLGSGREPMESRLRNVARCVILWCDVLPRQGLTFWPAWAYPLPESAPGLTSTFVYVPVCWPPASAPCILRLHRRRRRRRHWRHRWPPLLGPPRPPPLRSPNDDCGYDDRSRCCCDDGDGDGGGRGDGDDDDGLHRRRRVDLLFLRCRFRSNRPRTQTRRCCADPSHRPTTNHLLTIF